MRYYIMLPAIFSLVGCALPQTDGTAENIPLEQWQNTLPKKMDSTSLDDAQSLAIFYRLDNIPGSAVNIYVNQDYQTSLLDNAFSQIILCADQNQIEATFSGTPQLPARNEGQSVAFLNQQTSYLKVSAVKNGKPVLTRIAADTALAELGNLPQQAQTLSRVKQSHCLQQNYILEISPLDTNIQFGFDQYRLNTLSPVVQLQLQTFVNNLHTWQNGTINQIQINGYSDPSGQTVYNQKLSEKRAAAVRDFLLNAGVKQPIQINGYGESALRVSDCDMEYPNNQSLKHYCNAVNRRVDILVYGNNS
ncbi:hypothetical protein A1D23_08010 [Chelonobacter oris]|uniref:OmpA family protein n=1 Tax=Chelonobacter oris TaxID=505317 RepID=UPI00244B4105|nr:OmpA family protein [Chelonobacter oris]MDH3000135.1 hypothetical protein [Chelonobacter oris]